MNKIPAFLSTFRRTAMVIKTMKLAISVYKTVGTARAAVTACGKRTCPIPIERVESTIQEPMMSPIAIS